MMRAGTIVVCGLLVSSMAGADTGRATAYNEVAVLVDVSGSFAKHIEHAITQTGGFMRALAQGAGNRKRWERRQDDTLAVISVDALPVVVWSGPATAFDAPMQDQCMARLRARAASYGNFSDISRAFALAAAHLQGPPGVATKYGIAFTDLVHSAPAANGKPWSRTTVPMDFPWDALAGVPLRVYGVPPEVQRVYRDAADARGWNAPLIFLAEDEMATATLVALPLATLSREVVHAQRTEARQALGSFVGTLARIAIIGIVSVVGVIGIIAGVPRVRRVVRRVPVASPAAPRKEGSNGTQHV